MPPIHLFILMRRRSRRAARPSLLRPAACARLLRPAAVPLSLLVVLGACSSEPGPAAGRPGSPRPLATAEDPHAQAPRGSEARPLAQRRHGPELAIFSALRQEPLVRGHRVRVRGDGARIVLGGTLPSPAARERVLEIADAHRNGLTVVDSLVVAPAPGVGERGASAGGNGGSR